MKRQELRAAVEERIRDAWASAQMPMGDQLVPECWGDYGECRSAFEGHLWDSLAFETIMCNRQCVRFLLKPALAYYLPAYLLASIKEFEEVQYGWDITDDTLDGIKLLVEASALSAASLTEKQLIAIERYLAFLREETETRETIADVEACQTLLRRALGRT